MDEDEWCFSNSITVNDRFGIAVQLFGGTDNNKWIDIAGWLCQKNVIHLSIGGIVKPKSTIFVASVRDNKRTDSFPTPILASSPILSNHCWRVRPMRIDQQNGVISVQMINEQSIRLMATMDAVYHDCFIKDNITVCG